MIHFPPPEFAAPPAVLPRTLVMVPLVPPHICGSIGCTHRSCQWTRERALRRCRHCDHQIAPGERFIEYRNRDGHLVHLEHEQCPASK